MFETSVILTLLIRDAVPVSLNSLPDLDLPPTIPLQDPEPTLVNSSPAQDASSDGPGLGAIESSGDTGHDGDVLPRQNPDDVESRTQHLGVDNIDCECVALDSLCVGDTRVAGRRSWPSFR